MCPVPPIGFTSASCTRCHSGGKNLGHPAPVGLPNVSGCALRRIVWMNAESICSTLADEASEKLNGLGAATEYYWIANFCTSVKKMWICSLCN